MHSLGARDPAPPGARRLGQVAARPLRADERADGRRPGRDGRAVRRSEARDVASIVYELALALGTAVMVGAYFVIELPDLEDQPARYAVLAGDPARAHRLVHPRVFGPLVELGAAQARPRADCPGALPFRRVLAAVPRLHRHVGADRPRRSTRSPPSLTRVDTADLPYIAASYPVAFCVAVLTFIVPSGIGTRDAALAAAMAAVLPGAVATAIAVALRIFQTALELLLDRLRGAGRPLRPSAAAAGLSRPATACGRCPCPCRSRCCRRAGVGLSGAAGLLGGLLRRRLVEVAGRSPGRRCRRVRAVRRASGSRCRCRSRRCRE